MVRLSAELGALFLATALFSFCTSFVPRQQEVTTLKPTEETYTNDNNKPSEIKHLKYPNPFSIFEPHIPMFRIPPYPKIKDQNFGIEPYLMISGRRKRSIPYPLGQYFFAQRMMVPQFQPNIEYNLQEREVEPCNVTANESCSDEGIFAMDQMPSTWQVEKRKDPLPVPPSSPLSIKARRPYDVPQIGKSYHSTYFTYVLKTFNFLSTKLTLDTKKGMYTTKMNLVTSVWVQP
ncbi:uncharacterized protein TNCT_522171 [Trichonephila clavata]|uniref:Uncharacterized protein n=1 Tax=Trichonephila clavata TaxID=2740835 RepID=A0A8X6LH58_TRICU|nr:uncharacterized protein TNCT_522171 [Trichonephila clavata]